MSLPAFATMEDLEARMGVVLDEARARAALEDASNLIRAEAHPVTWVDDDTGDLSDDVPGVVKTICIRVARRSLENPQALSSMAEALGSYQLTTSFTEAYLTNAERRDIRRAAGKGALGSIRFSRGPVGTPSGVREVDPEETR